MNEFLVQGTLGDTYIACCKLVMLPMNNITVWHKTIHKYWIQEIHDIYELVPLVNPLFAGTIPKPLPEITSNVHEGEMCWFPFWGWPKRHEYTNIKEEYVVIQPEAGKPKGFNHKELKNKILYNEINNSDLPVVILGTSDKYKHLRCNYNLIGKTSVIDAMRIVSKAKKFIGPEGLLAFVALSHKIESDVYFKSHQAVEIRILNSPWEAYCNELSYVNLF